MERLWRQVRDEFSNDDRLGFDVLFGFVLPAVCLLMDPFVVSIDDAPRGARPRVGGCRGISLGVSCDGGLADRHARQALGSHSDSRWAARSWSRARAAAAVGAVLLPFSVIGMFVGIGFLGLVPFGTAIAMIRNAGTPIPSGGQGRRAAPAIVGALVFVALPSLVFLGGPFSRRGTRCTFSNAAARTRSRKPARC